MCSTPLLVAAFLLAGCTFPEPPSGPGGSQLGEPSGRPPGASTGVERGTPAGPPPDASEDSRLVPIEGVLAEGDGTMVCEATPASLENTPPGGERTIVSGAVVWDGAILSRVLLDLVNPEGFVAVYGFECRGAGEFSVEVPRSIGEVVAIAFVDNSQDGPSADDPQGRTAESIQLNNGDVGGVVITAKEDGWVDGLGGAGPKAPSSVPSEPPADGDGG